jgi:hypothetical protein
MAVKGASVAYCAVGGLILYSGIKGATIADTIRSALKGNLNVKGTETVGTGDTGNLTASATPSANYITVAKFLKANGYSSAAAAGITGCVAGESAGDPEAKGDQGTSFGLIQEHGMQYAGLVTGNPSKDLDSQLSALLAYNNAQGSGLITMLNAIPDPVEAAKFYSENFERPAVKDSDVRASVATSVYAQLTGGK